MSMMVLESAGMWAGVEQENFSSPTSRQFFVINIAVQYRTVIYRFTTSQRYILRRINKNYSLECINNACRRRKKKRRSLQNDFCPPHERHVPGIYMYMIGVRPKYYKLQITLSSLGRTKGIETATGYYHHSMIK